MTVWRSFIRMLYETGNILEAGQSNDLSRERREKSSWKSRLCRGTSVMPKRI